MSQVNPKSVETLPSSQSDNAAPLSTDAAEAIAKNAVNAAEKQKVMLHPTQLLAALYGKNLCEVFGKAGIDDIARLHAPFMVARAHPRDVIEELLFQEAVSTSIRSTLLSFTIPNHKDPADLGALHRSADAAAATVCKLVQAIDDHRNPRAARNVTTIGQANFAQANIAHEQIVQQGMPVTPKENHTPQGTSTRSAADPKLADGCTHSASPSLDSDFAGAAVAVDSGGPVLEIIPPGSGDRRQWPKPLSDAAYHGLIGEVARKIAPHTEADPVAVLMHLLTGVGNLIGRDVHFRVGGAEHPLNLFTAYVGRTSKGRKGTAFADTFQLLRRVDRQWEQEHIQTGLSSGEGLIWAVRDTIYKQERNRKSRQMEETMVDAGVADKRLLVIEPELASVLQRMGRESNTLSSVLRLAWDGQDLRVLTKNTPAVATRPHISLIGHITEDELRRELTNTEAANGFANRFLWLCVERSKLLPDGGALHTVDFARDVQALKETVAFARKTMEGPLARDEAARELWNSVYAELSEGRAGMFGAVTSRAEAQVMRLAGLYAIMDLSYEIRPAHLLAGLELWRYAEESAWFIFGASLGDCMADDILAGLRRSPEGLSRTHISRLFSGHKDAQQVGRALSMLHRERLAQCGTRSTGGRPVEHWFALGAAKSGMN